MAASKRETLEAISSATGVQAVQDALPIIGRELQCPVCLSIFDDPVMLRCNHHFCSSCVGQALKFDNRCPMCKEPCNMRGVSKVPWLDRLVAAYCDLCNAVDNESPSQVGARPLPDDVPASQPVRSQPNSSSDESSSDNSDDEDDHEERVNSIVTKKAIVRRSDGETSAKSKGKLPAGDAVDHTNTAAGSGATECRLCRMAGDELVCGKLKLRETSDGPMLLHWNCVCWCPEVYSTTNGKGVIWHEVGKAIRRGSRLKCHLCEKQGATIGCSLPRCRASFHYGCAARSDAHFYVNSFNIRCVHHIADGPVIQSGDLRYAKRLLRLLHKSGDIDEQQAAAAMAGVDKLVSVSSESGDENPLLYPSSEWSSLSSAQSSASDKSSQTSSCEDSSQASGVHSPAASSESQRRSRGKGSGSASKRERNSGDQGSAKRPRQGSSDQVSDAQERREALARKSAAINRRQGPTTYPGKKMHRVTFSGIAEDRQRELINAADGADLPLTVVDPRTATPEVILLETRDDLLVANRTFFYYWGILKRIKLLSLKWLQESVADKKWRSKDAYEILGDVFSQRGVQLGASLSTGRKLFGGLTFVLDGPFDPPNMSEDEIEHLIRLAGGIVRVSIPSRGREKVRVLAPEPEMRCNLVEHGDGEPEFAEVGKLVPRVSWKWLVDCISAFEILPLQSYRCA